jgi:hypothetical protein
MNKNSDNNGTHVSGKNPAPITFPYHCIQGLLGCENLLGNQRIAQKYRIGRTG